LFLEGLPLVAPFYAWLVTLIYPKHNDEIHQCVKNKREENSAAEITDQAEANADGRVFKESCRTAREMWHHVEKRCANDDEPIVVIARSQL